MINRPTNVWQALLAFLDNMPGNGSEGAGGRAKPVPIALTTAGDNLIISPSSELKSLRISGLYFVCASAVMITLKSDQIPISGAMSLTDHAVDYFHPLSLEPGKDFVINLATAIAVNGYVTYWEV